MRFPDQYEEWIDNLPAASRNVFNAGVITAQWYDLDCAAVAPTKQIGHHFFRDIKKGAWESGRFSAEQALNGVYKLYVKFSSPEHIIDRASRVLSAYYENSEIGVVEKSKNSVELAITKFDGIHEVIEYRIGGVDGKSPRNIWLQRPQGGIEEPYKPRCRPHCLQGDMELTSVPQ